MTDTSDTYVTCDTSTKNTADTYGISGVVDTQPRSFQRHTEILS